MLLGRIQEGVYDFPEKVKICHSTVFWVVLLIFFHHIILFIIFSSSYILRVITTTIIITITTTTIIIVVVVEQQQRFSTYWCMLRLHSFVRSGGGFLRKQKTLFLTSWSEMLPKDTPPRWCWSTHGWARFVLARCSYQHRRMVAS